MAITDYTAALKKGKRNYQLALAKGAYPYLPALDDILSFTEVTASGMFFDTIGKYSKNIICIFVFYQSIS